MLFATILQYSRVDFSLIEITIKERINPQKTLERVRIARMTFAVWLNEEYLKYQLRAGGKLPLSAFAGYLNVNASTLSSWLCGDRSPNQDNLQKLANGEAQLGFAQLDAYAKYLKDGGKQMEIIGSLGKECGYLIVKKDGKVTSEKDLRKVKDATIAIGDEGSGSSVMWQ